MPPHVTEETAAGRSGMSLICEFLIAATACLAPWAFGSVDAWADLALVIGVALLAACCAIHCWKTGSAARLMNLPGLAIAGLALLAWVQMIPLPAAVYERLHPAGYAQLKKLIPTTSMPTVRGDDGPPTPRPVMTLSQDRDETLRPAVQLTAAFILFECIVSLGGGYRTLRRFGLAVTVNACALTLFALIQALTWKGKIYGIRQSPIPEAWFSGGPFVSYHHLAAYLNFGLGFALAFALGGSLVAARPGSRVRHVMGYRISPLALYATGLIAVGVIASHSRGGFLAMVVSGAVLALALRRQPPRVWFGMAVVLLFAGLFLFAIGTESPLERLSTIWETSQTGFNGRSEIWMTSVQAWLANPVFGLGLGCFPAGAAPFYEFERESLFFHAENDYLEVLAEGGIIGFALGLLALAAIARLGLRVREGTNECGSATRGRCPVRSGRAGGQIVRGLPPAHPRGRRHRIGPLCLCDQNWPGRPGTRHESGHDFDRPETKSRMGGTDRPACPLRSVDLAVHLPGSRRTVAGSGQYSRSRHAVVDNGLRPPTHR